MLRTRSNLLWAFWLALALGLVALAQSPAQQQQPFKHEPPATAKAISVAFFVALERLARLVDIAYCIGTTGVHKPFSCASRCKDFPGLSLVNTWNTGVLLSDSCGYIAVDEGEEDSDGAIIVAFRGTYSITNTVVDLSTIPQKYAPYPSPDDAGDGPPREPEHECTNCTVHMGFLKSWKNARELVLPELKALKAAYPSYPIQIVGHSLGGAVACLAALELKVSLGWDAVTVTTFGEPRVGNDGLVRFVDEVFDLDGDEEDLESRSYRRVTHSDDPVPLLPPGEWGYRPHAGEIYISKKDLSPSETDIRTCVGDGDPECSAGADTDMRDTLRRLASFMGLGHSTENEIQKAGFPTRLKIWQLFFAHRDYFWRLGLCVPGGDLTKWAMGAFDKWESTEL